MPVADEYVIASGGLVLWTISHHRTTDEQLPFGIPSTADAEANQRRTFDEFGLSSTLKRDEPTCCGGKGEAA